MEILYKIKKSDFQLEINSKNELERLSFSIKKKHDLEFTRELAPN